MGSEERSTGSKLKQWLESQDLNSLTPRMIKGFFLDALLDNQSLKAALSDIAENRHFHAAICGDAALRKIHLSAVKSYIKATYSKKICIELSEILTEGVELLTAKNEDQSSIGSELEKTEFDARFHQSQLWNDEKQLEIPATTSSARPAEADTCTDELTAKFTAALDSPEFAAASYDIEAMQKKLQDGSFDFDDFAQQMKLISAMGDLRELMNSIPGMERIEDKALLEGEKQLKKIMDMIDAMTFEERRTPELLAESEERRKRISESSQHTEEDVKKVVTDFMQMREFMQATTNNQSLYSGFSP